MILSHFAPASVNADSHIIIYAKIIKFNKQSVETSNYLVKNSNISLETLVKCS